MIKKQFTLYLENRPGELARLAGRLAKAKVNIEGISVAESTHVALVQIVVDKAAGARRVLTALKIPFTTQDVAIVELENRPGSLAAIAAKLTKAGVNISYVYATACNCVGGCACKSLAIISAPNLKKVEAIAW